MAYARVEDNKTNYSFRLKCLAALTAVSLVTAGIIASVAIKSTAVTLAGVAVAATLATSPVLGILLALGAACLILPLLCISGYRAYNRDINFSSRLFSPVVPIVVTDPWFPASNMHAHSSGGILGGGAVHHHGGGSVHHHSGGHVGGHTHGHP